MMNLTADKLLPWQRFKQIEDKLEQLSSLEFVTSSDNLPNMTTLLNVVAELTTRSNNLAARAHIALSGGERVSVDGAELHSRAADVMRQADSDLREVNNVVNDVIDLLSNRCVERQRAAH